MWYSNRFWRLCRSRNILKQNIKQESIGEASRLLQNCFIGYNNHLERSRELSKTAFREERNGEVNEKDSKTIYTSNSNFHNHNSVISVGGAPHEGERLYAGRVMRVPV